jgi:hypothetical protein
MATYKTSYFLGADEYSDKLLTTAQVKAIINAIFHRNGVNSFEICYTYLGSDKTPSAASLALCFHSENTCGNGAYTFWCTNVKAVKLLYNHCHKQLCYR